MLKNDTIDILKKGNIMTRKKTNNKNSALSLSIEYRERGTTQIDNKFLKQYLPVANPLHSQVYLYALFNAVNNIDKSFDELAKDLNLTIDEILTAFKFWEKEGLVLVSQTRPFTVSYLSVHTAIPLELREGLLDFTELKQELSTLNLSKIRGFDFLEIQKIVTENSMEIPAVKQVINYFIKFRKFSTFPVILREFRKWAASAKTFAEANERIQEDQKTTGAIIEIKKNLLYKSKELEPDQRELALFAKWEKLGFSQNALMPVSKYVATNFEDPSMFAMDVIVEELKEKKLFEANRINLYLVQQQQYRKLAIDVNKNLGNYEGNLTAIVDNYISKWLEYGYTPEAIKIIATICYKYKEISTPQRMNQYINIVFEDKIVGEKSIKELEKEFEANDIAIREIIKAASSSHIISSFDRELYKYAKKSFNYDDEILKLTAEKAKGKLYPLNEIIKILEPIYASGARTFEEVKKALETQKTKKASAKKDPDEGITKSSNDQVKDFQKGFENFKKLSGLQLFDDE